MSDSAGCPSAGSHSAGCLTWLDVPQLDVPQLDVFLLDVRKGRTDLPDGLIGIGARDACVSTKNS